MTRICIVIALAAVMGMPASARAASDAQQTDTLAAARALVPLLEGVRGRLRPRTVVEPGTPPPSPFTGTQTTLLSFKVGKRETPIDPKVSKAMEELLAWKIGATDETRPAVLFDHWLTQLSVKSALIGLLDCDAACVVERFTSPDATFGQTQTERDEMRDQLMLDALSAAVDEIEPGR